MNKEEILRYVSENYELPQEAMQYSNDTEFFIEILEIESSIRYDLPIEVQKKILLINDKYLDEADTKTLFEDEQFAKALVDKNNDILLKLRGLSIDNEYIKNLTISYIKGERTPAKGSLLERMNPRKIYASSIKEVREDHELALYLIGQNIDYLSDIKDSTICDNPDYINEYVKKHPHTFSKYLEKISNYLTPEVIEAVLKYDFQNYTLIDKNNPLMEQFYKSIDRIKEVRPELKMDNPNLRYELLCDSDFINMDINIINSLLEYNTGNVDKIIEIKNNGKLEYLTRYIEQYNSLYGNNLENIQNAISSFEQMKQLLISTNNFDGISIDEAKLKTIIATGNKFGIENFEDLLNYNEKVKEYYANKLQEATSIEDIKKIYTEMLFNTSSEELEKFNEQYCNCNIDELDKYSKRKYEKAVWQCIKRAKHGKEECPYCKAIPEEIIEDCFVQGYKILCNNNKKIVEDFLEKIESILKENTTETVVNKLEKDKEKINKKLNNLLELNLEGRINKEQYTLKYDELNTELLKVEQKIQTLLKDTNRNESIKYRLNKFKSLFKDMEIIKNFDKDVFECLIDKVVIGETLEDETINPYTIRFICKNGTEINCKDNFTATSDKQATKQIATSDNHPMWNAWRC